MTVWGVMRTRSRPVPSNGVTVENYVYFAERNSAAASCTARTILS